MSLIRLDAILLERIEDLKTYAHENRLDTMEVPDEVLDNYIIALVGILEGQIVGLIYTLEHRSWITDEVLLQSKAGQQAEWLKHLSLSEGAPAATLAIFLELFDFREPFVFRKNGMVHVIEPFYEPVPADA